MSALALVVALLVGCASGAPTPTPSDGLVHLTILQVNDVYALEPVDGGRSGGLARLATLVREERRRNPATLFMLGGDLISPSLMSTVLRGEQMIAAFNAIGLDLATFGNHEFDFGPDVLAARMRESKFTWVSSNVVDAAGRSFAGARPDTLVELGGLKVGVFGLTLAETAHLSAAGSGVQFRDPYVAGRDAAARLRQAGAHVVVGLTHMEMGQDKELARRADVDVIVGGHEHEPLVAEERKTLITKAGSDARYLLRIDLWLTREGKLVERSWLFRHVSARVEADPAVTELVRGYTARLTREMTVVVGKTTVLLDARSARVRTEETNVGNLIADTARQAVDAQVALMNGGGIRGDRLIPAGPLTRGDIIGLLPFTNTVVKLQMPGRTLRQAIEHGLAQTDRVGGGYLQVSGVRLAWNPRRPAGSRIARIDVAGRPLDDGARYVVAVPSYLFGGGDGFAFRDATVLVPPESGPDLAGLVVKTATDAGSIAPAIDGRVIRVTD